MHVAADLAGILGPLRGVSGIVCMCVYILHWQTVALHAGATVYYKGQCVCLPAKGQ